MVKDIISIEDVQNVVIRGKFQENCFMGKVGEKWKVFYYGEVKETLFKVKCEWPEIRFSQCSISRSFSDGRGFEGTIKDIKDGKWEPVVEGVVLQNKGGLVSVDNRRLYCMKNACAKYIFVKIRKFNLKKDGKKLSSYNDGKNVYICKNNEVSI